MAGGSRPAPRTRQPDPKPGTPAPCHSHTPALCTSVTPALCTHRSRCAAAADSGFPRHRQRQTLYVSEFNAGRPAVPDRRPEPGSRTPSPAPRHSRTPALCHCGTRSLRHSALTGPVAPLPPTAGSRDTGNDRLCKSVSSTRNGRPFPTGAPNHAAAQARHPRTPALRHSVTL
jgi:hypothetical protein